MRYIETDPREITMNDHIQRTVNYHRASLFLLGLIAFLLVSAALKFTTPIVLPFVIAVLLTFVLEPLVHLLCKLKIPRAVAAVVVVLAIGIGVYFTGLLLVGSIRTIASLYPKYEAKFEEIYRVIAVTFELPYDSQLTLFDNLWSQLNVRQKVQSLAISFSESFVGFAKDTMMVVLFIVFLLLEIGHLKERANLAFAKTFPGGLQNVINAIVLQTTRYLNIKFFISLATGVLVGIGLSLIDMDFPVVWGVLSFVLNFIPTIGSIAAGFGVGLFALVQFYPDPVPIVIAVSIMLGVNMILGNILEPRIAGDHLGLSPFVILVSLLGWSWLWGFAGLILAVPMTVIVKIVCEEIPGLEAVSILLGSYKAAKKKEHKKADE
jgi:predicted PurR-regulated permease PerM